MASYEPATYIVGWKDPNEAKTEDIITINGRGMNDARASLRDQPVVNYRPTKRIFKAGDILFVDWIIVSTDDWVVANSIMSVPVTFKNTRTEEYVPTYIELAGKYAWTTTLVGTTGVRLKAGRYIIPNGMTMVLGHKRPHNSRLLINLYDAD